MHDTTSKRSQTFCSSLELRRRAEDGARARTQLAMYVAARAMYAHPEMIYQHAVSAVAMVVRAREQIPQTCRP